MVNSSIFIKAGIITIILLILSLIVGGYVENMAYSKISGELIKINEDQEAILILQSFADENDTSRVCNLLKSQMDSINGKIYILRSELEAQTSTSMIKDYDMIRREYFIANARLLSLTKQHAKKCGGNDEIILFFYTSEKQCPECHAQGRIIDEVRQRCANVRVFSFPTDVDMLILKSFMAYYGMVQSPSVVIDRVGRYEVFNGPASAEDIITKINCVSNKE